MGKEIQKIKSLGLRFDVDQQQFLSRIRLKLSRKAIGMRGKPLKMPLNSWF